MKIGHRHGERHRKGDYAVFYPQSDHIFLWPSEKNNKKMKMA